MKISERLDKLELTVMKHLEESGEIRSDLKWVKKFLWFVLSMPIMTEIFHRLWK